MVFLFSFFILCHLIGDFIFQFDCISKNKESCNNIKRYGFLAIHISIHLLTMVLVYFIINPISHHYYKDYLISGLIICSLHLIIDFLKYPLSKSKIEKIWLYCIDQSLHFLSIYAVLVIILKKNFFMFLNKNLYLSVQLNITEKLFISLSIFIIGTYFAAYFIKNYLSSKKIIDDSNPLSFGFKIGIIERTLAILLVVTNNYPTLAVIIALKTLTRYTKIEENKDFGDYYLMGNLLSLLFSISAGILIKFIISSP